MEQLPGIQYCINSPPPWSQYIAMHRYRNVEALVLGFQHYIMTLGTTVLIPTMFVNQMGGGNVEKAKVIQTLLFVSGFNTLLQSLFGTRLPSVISGSFSFIVPMTSILHAKRYQTTLDPYERFEQIMRGMQGALIITSCFQMLISFLGLWRNVVRFLTPLSMVPLITFTGLGFCYLGFSMIKQCDDLLDLIHLQYLPHYVKTKSRICDRFSVLFSISCVWAYAQILTSSGAYNKASFDTQASCRTDHAGLISGAPWIHIPYPFQWGRPTFNAGEAFAMMVASIVASIESTSTFLATARYGSATPVPASILSRGVGWLGFGTLLAGVFGSVTGPTASVENAGLLALTRIGSRRVIQISAGFMIFFSIIDRNASRGIWIDNMEGKKESNNYLICLTREIWSVFRFNTSANCSCFILFLLWLPASGLGLLQYCNLNSFRTKFILGFSFFLGLSVPQYFREFQLSSGASPVHTHSRWFNDIVTVIFTSHATVAALVAMLLDCTLSREDDVARKDSGSQWWEKFIFYNADVRSDDFYKLPCKLNKLFPPL
ncbi:hypothetical protein HYC85_008353 [Camellia sinensis]|uniref:Uncharacterized protein n=1 Tax=Camellia sinensis TaxID=4442 RepID=A0A7J7HSZ0_CAMSI|nr:hypothetical protein HYC85_008353 [Camellia sinensis]